MNGPHIPTILHEVERLARQAEQLRPCWEELLEQAHVVSEELTRLLQEQAQAAGDADRSPLST